MKEKEYVSTTIDDVHLHARHFVSLGKDKTVKELLVTFPDKDEKWAKKAFDTMVENVKSADNPLPTADDLGKAFGTEEKPKP